MAFQDEIPNSQPSSPGLSSLSPDDEVAISNANDTSIPPSANLPEDNLFPTNLNKYDNPSSHQPTPEDRIKAGISPSKTIRPSSSPHKPNPPTSSTHKPLSATLTKPSLQYRRRPTTGSTHSPAYLRQRITILQTTLASTHTQLTATLAELQSHVAAQNTTGLGISCPTTLKASATPTQERQGQRQQQQQQYELTAPQQQALNHASSILQTHVSQLGKYNAVKDIAMGMLGIVAEREGRTVREVLALRGISEDD